MTGSRKHQDARGRDATRVRDIPLSGWYEILRRVKAEMGQDHVSIISAGVAFFALLALFPALASLLSLAALVVDPMEVEAQLAALAAALPPEAATILLDQGEELAAGAGSSHGLAAIAGLLVSLYSASKGMKSLIEGMNVAYEEEEKRGFVRLNLEALALTVLLVVGLLAALGAVIVLPATLDSLGLGRSGEALVAYGRWILLAGLAIVGLAVLYRYAPSRDQAKWRWLSPGALTATFLWVVGSAAFSFYVDNFASYNETYGAIGGVIILLTWLWLSAFIVLFGAELNSEIEHQTRRDTTTGPAEPLGERGAAMADTVPQSTVAS